VVQKPVNKVVRRNQTWNLNEVHVHQQYSEGNNAAAGGEIEPWDDQTNSESEDE